MVGDFLSYLILPIQRIPRYRMLLESIIAATPQTHPDYQLLTEALSKISEIATYINERKRQQERGREVMRVYKAIFPTIDDLIQPGRQLLLEGPLHDALADEVEQYWFLFDDLMLMTKEARKGEKYKLKGRASVRVSCQSFYLVAFAQLTWYTMRT
jgi:FYVE/RhoGEF/PH domain-containing protein 5/6